MGILDQDNVNTSLRHTEAYTYDSLNRITSALATGNSTYNLTFAYDRYGNMTCQTNAQTQGLCPNYSYNSATNQINTSGFTYDAAGNLIADGQSQRSGFVEPEVAECTESQRQEVEPARGKARRGLSPEIPEGHSRIRRFREVR